MLEAIGDAHRRHGIHRKLRRAFPVVFVKRDAARDRRQGDGDIGAQAFAAGRSGALRARQKKNKCCEESAHGWIPGASFV
jgi:hypothetical protein